MAAEIFFLPDVAHRHFVWPIHHVAAFALHWLPERIKPPPTAKTFGVFFGQKFLDTFAAFLCYVAARRVFRLEQFEDTAALEGDCLERAIFDAIKPGLDDPVFDASAYDRAHATFAALRLSGHLQDALSDQAFPGNEDVEVRDAALLHFHHPGVHAFSPPLTPGFAEATEHELHFARCGCKAPGEREHRQPGAFGISEIEGRVVTGGPALVEDQAALSLLVGSRKRRGQEKDPHAAFVSDVS